MSLRSKGKGQAEGQAEQKTVDPRSADASDDEFFEWIYKEMGEDILAAKTLTGDIRDHMLDEIKAALRDAGTSIDKVAESAQRRIIANCTDYARDLARNLVRLSCTMELHPLPIAIGKFSVEMSKDGPKIISTLGVPFSPENLVTLGEMLGEEAVILAIDITAFDNARKAAQPTVIGSLKIPVPEQQTDEQKRAAAAAAAGADPTTGELPPEAHPQAAAVVDKSPGEAEATLLAETEPKPPAPSVVL